MLSMLNFERKTIPINRCTHNCLLIHQVILPKKTATPREMAVCISCGSRHGITTFLHVVTEQGPPGPCTVKVQQMVYAPPVGKMMRA